MKRANLLLTDQPSSVVKMATTGQSTASGSTRTKAAKGLFSHFMFLTGVLLITLLTSGKASADENYTITLTDAENCHITIQEGTTLPQATKAFTLVPDAGYKLPEAAAITVSITGGADITLGTAGEAEKWSYDNGVITLDASVSLTQGITIKAAAIELKNIATLATLTYQVQGEDETPVTGFMADAAPEAEGYTVNLPYTNKDITVVGTATAGSNATVINPEAVSATKAVTTGATVTVAPEDGSASASYVVKFLIAKDKLAGITVTDDLSRGLTLTKRSTQEEILTLLNETSDYNTFAITTEGLQPGLTLPVSWKFKGDKEFDAAPKADNTFVWEITAKSVEDAQLELNGKTLTGEVVITNPDASTDAKLSALTYSIDGGDSQTISSFNASDNDDAQDYSVTLPTGTLKGAKLTVQATPADKMAKIEEKELVAVWEDNKATISFTVTPEDSENGKVRTITITFTRTPSAVVTLSELKYTVNDGAETNVTGFKPEDSDGETYPVVLPYNTPADAIITILPVTTDKNAVVTPVEKTVTLKNGKESITLTVIAENGSQNQKILIQFTTAKEKITSVTAPEAPVLTQEMTEEEVLTEVQKIATVAVTSEGATLTELPVTWALDDEFKATHGAKNSYTWTITENSYADYDINGKTTTGRIEVTNFIAAVTDNDPAREVTIDENDPFTQIGDGEAETTLKSVTVSTELENLAFDKVTVKNDVTVSSAVDALAFSKTTIEGALAVNAAVSEMSFNGSTLGNTVTINANVGTLNLVNTTGQTLDITSAANGLTLVAEGSTSIKNITNSGVLTLDNASPAAVNMLSVETKASALANKGGVEAIENNKTFTDNTANIVVVTGAADLAITSLPASQSTTGSSVDLSVVTAEPANGTITYQWQKNINNNWIATSGKGNKTTTLTVGKTEDGAGSFRCQVVSTNGSKGATTTLYTPAVTVTFRDAVNPPTPVDPVPSTYTVKLPKVEGATFSQGETTTVTEGDDFSFTITLAKDYDQSQPVVKVGNATYAPDSKGVYTIEAIAQDMTIEVSGIMKNAATGIEDATVDTARAWSEGATLYIHTPETADVCVFSGAGVLLQQLHGVSGDRNMQLRSGFYIIRIGTYTAKVIIR